AGFLLCHLLLWAGWKKLALVVIALVVSTFKNAVRIVFLARAGKYLGVDLLNSSLHHRYGGTVFSVVGLAILIPVLVLLRRSERKGCPRTGKAAAGKS